MQNNPVGGYAIMAALAVIIIAAIAAPGVCGIVDLLVGDSREINFWRTAGADDVASRLRWRLDVDDTRRRYSGSSYEDGAPLHWAAAYTADPEVITLLLDKGADLEARSSYDRTPLHWAALSNAEPAIIARLLAHGANVNAREVSDWTPLHSAARAETDNPAVIALLLEHGADIMARGSYGATPLHNAADAYHPKPMAIALLLDRGAVIDATDGDGWTPLHRAAATGALRAYGDYADADFSDAALLLAHGANPAARTADGETACDLANRHGAANAAVRRLLCQPATQ